MPMPNMLQKNMIQLKLEPGENSFAFVKNLEGIKGLSIDDDFGLVCTSPKRHLYTIVAIGNVDRELLMDIQPRVQGVYGQVKISEIKTP
jgi:hypothetical protein